MTYTNGYQPQGASAYSPFNRNAAPPTTPDQTQNFAYQTGAASPFAPTMGSDTFVPVSSPEDMDRVVSSIDDKIARIRQAFNQPLSNSPSAPQPPSQVSQSDIQWALQLEQKVKSGQQPTAQETARYEDIARRLSGAQQPQQAPAPTQQQSPQVSQDEIQWALQLEQKVKSGQQPTAQETARYEDIARRLSGAQQPQQAPTPAQQQPPQVSQDEIQWALQLEQKVKSGQQPTAQETARYEDIARRLSSAQQPQQTPAATAPTGNRNWSDWSKPFAPPAPSAMPLPIAAPGSGQPAVTVPTSLRGAPQTPPAVAMTQYSGQSSATQPSPSVSQQEIQWALELEQKVNQQKYQPTPQETATYQAIAQRLSAAQGQPAPQTATPAQMPPAPQRQAVPQQPAATVSQQEIQWALQLEQKVKSGQQPTAQEVATYENIAQRLSTAQGQPASQTATPAQMPPAPQRQAAPQQPPTAPQTPAGVSQQEIQWALQLEQKVKSGQQPTAQEVATYENIAQRLSAAQGQPAPQTATPAQMPPAPQRQAAPQQPPTAPQTPAGVSQQEIQWALQLEQKVKSGQQPTAQEAAAYENIAQRLSAAQGQPTPQTAATMSPMPQRPTYQQPPQQVMMPPTPQPVAIVPQQYPYVQPQTPQYIVPPQPFMPQPAMPPSGYQQAPGNIPAPAQKPGFTDRLKSAWNTLWS